MSPKDLYESPKALQIALVWLVLTPGYYLSIFLFAPEIYKIGDVFLSGSICLIMTMISGFISLYVTIEARYNKKKENEILSSLRGTFAIFSWWLLLNFCLYTWYLWKDSIVTFYGFLIIYFFPLFAVWFFQWRISKRRLKMKKTLKEGRQPNLTDNTN